MAEFQTPKLDELEKAPWPSFVSDIKRRKPSSAPKPEKS